jgi:DNA-binding transcriptional MerR regulator
VSAGGAAAASPGPGASAPMSIGEVLAHLRAEFPDTTISKLRFLEAEGLVEPRRTASGYRKYGWDDVARLRFVLSAQRDHYLPLRVIREQLAELDAGDGAGRPALVSLPAEGAAPAGPDEVRLSRAELVTRSGVDEAVLGELEAMGMVVVRSNGWYDADALVVASAVAGLAAFGVGVRHLRPYKAAADREVGLFAQLLGPVARQNDPAARARAGEAAGELTALTQRLQGALVRAGLRDVLGR